MGAYAKKLFEGTITDATEVVDWELIGDAPALYIEHTGPGTLTPTVKVSPVAAPDAPSPEEAGEAVVGSTPVQWIPDLFAGPFRKLELSLAASGSCDNVIVYAAFVRP